MYQSVDSTDSSAHPLATEVIPMILSIHSIVYNESTANIGVSSITYCNRAVFLLHLGQCCCCFIIAFFVIYSSFLTFLATALDINTACRTKSLLTAFASMRKEMVFAFSSKSKLYDTASHLSFDSNDAFSNSSLFTNDSIFLILSTEQHLHVRWYSNFWSCYAQVLPFLWLETSTLALAMDKMSGVILLRLRGI